MIIMHFQVTMQHHLEQHGVVPVSLGVLSAQQVILSIIPVQTKKVSALADSLRRKSL